MEASFWRARWENGQTGFHNAEPHPLLIRNWPRLGVPPEGRVLVPLAGKSLDMQWLADAGHSVVGVELSELAAEAFFAAQGEPPEILSNGPFTVYRRGRIEIFVGDLFRATPRHIGPCHAQYDRAALIALPPPMRSRYLAQLQALHEVWPPTLLITVEYDPSLRGGPPFSVAREEVERLYDGLQVERIDSAPAPLKELTVIEPAYHITAKR